MFCLCVGVGGYCGCGFCCDVGGWVSRVDCGFPGFVCWTVFGSFPRRDMDLGFGSLRFFEYFGCFGCGNVIWFVLLCLDGVVFAGGIW